MVNQYLYDIGLAPGYPWCATFVYWCFEQASVDLNQVDLLIRTGGCLALWRKTKDTLTTLATALGY